MPVGDGLDLYEILGVSPKASDEEIKRAYRRKARQLHPDANGGDASAEAKFKEVTLAYEVLKDPERRARYDRFGPEGVFGSGGAPGGFGFDFEGGLGDLFEAFFGSMGATTRQRAGRPVPGPDAEVTLQLSFSEAVFGSRKEVSARLPVRCAACEGTGTRPGTHPTRCTDCGGTGEVRRLRQSLLGQVVTSSACGRCQGMGEMILSPCPDCRGEGRRTQDESLVVDVPAGVEHGSTLRLAGRGPAGLRGAPNGSLYVHLAVAADERFERAGDDLHTTLSIAMTQAALGAEVDVETLEEGQRLTIAPGTQSGQVIKLRGAGVPHLRGRGRGDLYVHLAVATPTALTTRQEELLRELAAERGDAVDPAHEGVLSRLRSTFT